MRSTGAEGWRVRMGGDTCEDRGGTAKQAVSTRAQQFLDAYEWPWVASKRSRATRLSDPNGTGGGADTSVVFAPVASTRMAVLDEVGFASSVAAGERALVLLAMSRWPNVRLLCYLHRHKLLVVAGFGRTGEGKVRLGAGSISWRESTRHGRAARAPGCQSQCSWAWAW